MVSDEIMRLDRRMQEDLQQRMLELDIPAYMHEGIVEYVCHGIEPGGFLTAVFEDKLVEAAAKADDTNAKKLYEYASLMYEPVPSACRGKENVSHWISIGGLVGFYKEKHGAVVDDEETKSGRKVRRDESEYPKPSKEVKP